MYQTFKKFYWLQFVLYPVCGFVIGVVSFKLWGTFVPAFVFGGSPYLHFYMRLCD